MKKFELSDVTITVGNVTLYCVKALRSWRTEHGTEINKGDLGGFVQSEDNLSQLGTCWIADEAQALGKSRIKDDALVCKNAIISGRAQVQDCAVVTDIAKVQDCAIVSDSAVVSGHAVIQGIARIKRHVDSGVYGNRNK
jgi:NDP-sugar pyrophosphorylase family protein